MAYFEGEIPVVTTGTNGSWGNGFNDSSWWIIVLLLFGYGGYGRGGYGNGGGAANDYVLVSDFAQIERKLDSLASGICDSTFALNNTIVNGFNNTNSAIMTQGFETRNAITGLSSQLASCCCDIEKALLENRYIDAQNFCALGNAISTQTRDILEGQREIKDAVLGFLTNEKISALMLENQTLKSNAFITANQEAQTAELIRRLGRDCPVPAFVVPNPNCCYTTPLTVANNNGGCGYGCC